MKKSYPGHKKISGLFQKIINHIPAHNRYYELFAGSAAIAKLLPGNEKYLVDVSLTVTENLKAEWTDKGIVIKAKATDILHTKLYRACTDTFVFMDPPYLHSTRPNNTNLYEHEMTEADHIKLLSSVLQLKCHAMIIHPKCELYDTMLKDWHTVTVKVRYHNKTSVERIYMNYRIEQLELQTDKYLGKDCWDRQRIKRKAKGYILKLHALPIHERKYIINQLNKTFKTQ